MVRANLIGADTVCSLSPPLFKMYPERVLRNWKRKCQPLGTTIQNTHTHTHIYIYIYIYIYIHSLNFAHDQVLLAQDHDDMVYMARKPEEKYEKWGLPIILEKPYMYVLEKE